MVVLTFQVLRIMARKLFVDHIYGIYKALITLTVYICVCFNVPILQCLPIGHNSHNTPNARGLGEL